MSCFARTAATDVAPLAARDEFIREIQAERVEAVSLRDKNIENLRAELMRLTAGWRRLVVGRPRV
jgi:hypothetical protein